MCHYRPVSFLITTGSKYRLPKSPPPKHGTLFSFSITVKNKKTISFESPCCESVIYNSDVLKVNWFQPPTCLCNLVLLYQYTSSNLHGLCLSFSPLADSGSGLPQADLLKLPFHLYLLCFPWKQSNLARVHTWRNHTLRTQVQIPEQKNEIDDLIPPMSSKPLRTHQQAPSMPASTEKKTKRKELGVGPICLWVQQPSVKNTAGGEKTSSSYTPLSLKSTAKHSWPKSTPREGHLKCTYYTTMWEPTEPAHTPTHCYTVYILHTLTPRCGCL